MPRSIKIILQLLAIVAIGSFSIWLAGVVTEDDSEKIANEIVKKVVVRPPQCEGSEEEFKSLRNQGSVVNLIDDPINTYGFENDGFANLQEVTIERTGTKSQVACGYLFVKAQTSDTPLEEWENVFINPSQFGGHLIQDQNTIINRKTDTASEILFSLDEIQYETPNERELQTANWSALLNVANEISFDVSLNTLDTTGTIQEVSIAYKCWNPKTGEETNDCELVRE